MKKLLIIALFLSFMLSGCARFSRSLTFNVTTEDGAKGQVEISLAAQGRKLAQGETGTFVVTDRKGKTLVDGIFMGISIDRIRSSIGVTDEMVVKESDDELVYRVLTENGTEYNRFVKVSDVLGAVCLASRSDKCSEEEAEEIFEALTFTVIEESAGSQAAIEPSIPDAPSVSSQETFGNVKFSLPDGFELSGGSIDVSRSYFNDNSQGIHMHYFPDDSVDIQRELYPSTPKTYGEFSGYVYTKNQYTGFVFYDGENTYTIEADDASVFKAVCASLTK